MVTIAHGADHETADLAGRTLGDVRTAYEHIFNIPDDATAKVNGQETTDEYVVQDEDKVVFEKRADKLA